MQRVLRISALVAVAIAVLLIVVVGHWRMGHRLTVKAYFSNVGGLREGATVRIAGVDIGSVRSVHVRPELWQEPVKMHTELNPPSRSRFRAIQLFRLTPLVFLERPTRKSIPQARLARYSGQMRSSRLGPPNI